MLQVDAEEVTANARRLRARIDSVRCEVQVVRDDFQVSGHSLAEIHPLVPDHQESMTTMTTLYTAS